MLPATQPVLAQALGCKPEVLFRSERPAGEFRWVAMPRFGDLVQARGGIGELAGRLDLDAGRVERWVAGSEPVAPETQLALLADFGLPLEERASLFTNRAPLDAQRPEQTWWASGLRPAVRAHPDLRSLGSLAARLEVPVQALFDQVECLEPVPADLRDRISSLLGPTVPGTGPVFTTGEPDWRRFLWAPGLRAALARAEMDASELAAALDVDLSRVYDWMELDQRPVGTRWARDRVQRGQIHPATCDAVVEVLGDRFARAELFSDTRPGTGALWAVKPTFGAAVQAFDGQLNGFAEEIDTDPDRILRWAEQVEPIEPHTQARILAVLGLKREDEGQLFAAEKRVEEAVG